MGGGFGGGVIVGGLVAAVIGLGVALALTAGDDDPAQPAISTITETRTVTEAATAPARSDAPNVAEFRSPSGNLLCRVTSRDATCGIADFSYAPPAQPADCELQGWGHSLAVGTVGGGAFLCTDQAPTSPDSEVLRYGYVLRLGPFECGSSTLGMLCENRQTGHGFVVSRERYRLY